MNAPRSEPIELRDGCVHVHVRVQPRASANGIRPAAAGCIRVSLTAPPVDGEANEALEAFLAKTAGIPKSAARVVRGEKSREKVVALPGIDLETARRLLCPR